MDTTAVESNIHYPTDNTLLRDVVRVVTRLSRSLLELHPHSLLWFPSRERAVSRRCQKISRSKRPQRQRELFRELLSLVQGVLRLSESLLQEDLGECTDFLEAKGLRSELSHYVKLGWKVVDQCERRVLKGEQVPASEKIISIFEPHGDIIVRGKAGKPVEFGHKVLLAEGKSGLITDYKVLEGNPRDYEYVIELVRSHRNRFSGYPSLLAGDRGFYNGEVEKICKKEMGIEEVSIPKKGYKNQDRRAYEKRREFREGQKFRNGIEGRISVLKRKLGMSRCRLKGLEGFERFIGFCVLVHNINKLAELIIEKEDRKKKRKRKGKKGA